VQTGALVVDQAYRDLSHARTVKAGIKLRHVETIDPKTRESNLAVIQTQRMQARMKREVRAGRLPLTFRSPLGLSFCGRGGAAWP
jgi:hypothetical protein